MNILVQFAGMKRSGNHAIIPWLMKNAFPDQEAVVFHNSIFDERKNPPLLTLPRHIAQTRAHNEGMIISYEDARLDRLTTTSTWTGEQDILPHAKIKHILLLRDPYNLFASRLGRLENTTRTHKPTSLRRLPWDNVIELWKTHAREYLGETHHLPPGVIGISFNDWFKSKAYRDRLLHDHFGVEKNLDRGIDNVENFAGGSTFDLLKYNGSAQEMEVLNRWQAYRNDRFFQKLTSDRELQALSERIFDVHPNIIERTASTTMRDRR